MAVIDWSDMDVCGGVHWLNSYPRKGLVFIRFLSDFVILFLVLELLQRALIAYALISCVSFAAGFDVAVGGMGLSERALIRKCKARGRCGASPGIKVRVQPPPLHLGAWCKKCIHVGILISV